MQRINKAGKMSLVREFLLTGVSSQADIRRTLAKPSLKYPSGIKISKTTICRYVKQILEEWAAAVAPETRERWRGKELAKLDKMEQKLHIKCMDGDIEAIRVRLRLMQHRADLLGLTEPETLNIILTPTVIQQRMEKRMLQDPVPVIPIDAEYEIVNDADDS
jgi:hypothetical protein